MARRGPTLMLGIVLVLTACAVGSENQTSEETLMPVRGGTVVFGAGTVEPVIMNPLTIDGNAVATAWVAQTLLEGAYETLPDFTYRPELLAREAEVTLDPFTVTYTIRDDATWSDGEPVGAADFEFTWETIIDPKFKAASRDGYDKITNSEIIDPKTIRFTFDEPFVPYRDLFNFVLPAHELEGENLNQVWDDEITVSSGPFELEQWKKGQFVTVVRNDGYRGEGPFLDEIVFRFPTDPGAQIQLFRSREADVLYPQPQIDLVEQLTSFGDASLEARAGAVWEHIDFNLERPLLQEPFVRQAIAHGIDRRAIVDRLVRPMHPDAEVLQNLIYMTNQQQYQPHFDRYGYDPELSARLLEDNGCERGEDGIYVCDGQRLSFRYTTIAGTQIRELQLEAVQEQLRQTGIEIVADLGDPSVIFGKVIPSGDWDLVSFTWFGGLDPSGGNAIWRCGGEQNFNQYCNREVTKLLEEASRETDPAERTAIYKRVDELMAQDLPVLPVYQRPTLMAWYGHVHGLQDNPTLEGPAWNAEEWFVDQP